MEQPKINPVPPQEEKETNIKPPANYAGGIPALQSSFNHLSEELTLNTAFQTLFQLNQKGGIDCPGCAWPDPDDHRSRMGEYCENGVKAIAEEATKKRVTPAFFQKHSIEELAQWTDYELGKSGRLTHPMFKEEGQSHYQPITWDKAFQIIAEALKHLNHPDEAAFYTSGRTSNEAAFLYQLMVRQFGTNNLPDCSNMCHESSGVALSETLGIGKGSVTLEDFYLTDLILIIGQNPGTNHPRMLSALQKAKKRGAKIITINPIPEAGLIKFKHPQQIEGWFGSGTAITDVFLQVKVNQDIALLKVIMQLLWKREQKAPGSIFDRPFIEKNTSEFQAFIDDLKEYDTDQLIAQCGVELSEIEKAVTLIADSEKIIACWAMGLTQHQNGVYNIREVVNLLLLKGSISKPGAGTCPVRGHSNVQGDRTMGIWESPKDAFLDKLQENFGFNPPRNHGYNAVRSINAMYEGKLKIFFAMGGNFLSATPDTHYTAKGLENCDLTVQVSTKLNRSHIVTGKKALILPCLGRTDIDIQNGQRQMVSVENSMGVVHTSEGRVKPPSDQLLSEPAIIVMLAQELFGSDSPIDWSQFLAHYDHIRTAIENTIPGFTDYNKRVRNPGGFYLPNGAREGKYQTKTSKAQFSVNPVNKDPLGNGDFLMMTIRSHDQFNTTIYGLDDRYRGISNGRKIVFINPIDLEELGLKAGDLVDLTSNYENRERRVQQFRLVPYPIASRCVATYFPEANPLVPVEQFADRSETPASKSVVIQIHPTNESD